MNKLEYNVINHSSNNSCFYSYNVFNNFYLSEFLDKYKNKPVKDRNIEDFSKELDHICMYAFWSKCEYEIVLKNWTGEDIEQKIDAYWQLKNNWNVFLNVAWEYVRPKRG